MKRFALALAALCLAALAGCGYWGGGADTADASQADALDPLTGEAARWPGQRPAAVVIHNGMKAARQWGIGDASVAIEALTEGDGDTSLCLVYPSLEAMPKVGPVTQGRDLYWQLLVCQQTIPVQRGAGVYAANLLDQYKISPLDALELGVKGCSYEGGWGQEDVTCWATSGSALAPRAEEAGVPLTLSALSADAEADSAGSAPDPADSGLPSLLPFGASSGGREGVASVQVVFSESSSTSFVYSADAGRYLMCRADGSAQADAGTGAQAAFDNLLILYSAPTRRDDGYSWRYDLTMGAGVYLSGGQVWSILWMPGSETTLSIYSLDGTPLDVNPGSSYIALLGSVARQELILLDAQGQQVTSS